MSAPLDTTAALLERAYRMALVLQGRVGSAAGAGVQADETAFEAMAVAAELVVVLDEARVALLVAGLRPAPAPPG